MISIYELPIKRTTIPVTMNFQQLGKKQLHRHKQLEIIFMLKGTINLSIQEEVYRLETGDIILINPYDLHGLLAASDDNLLLSFKIDTEYYDRYTMNFSNKRFMCNSTLFKREVALDKNSPFEELRNRLAMLAFQRDDSQLEYGFSLGIIMLDVGRILVKHFQSDITKNGAQNKDIKRLTRILDYIDHNFDKGINLKTIAEMENLNLYYLSSFIKQQLGVGFQEYVNMKRIDKVVNQLVMTNKSITEISFSSGFSTTKSLNQLFKKMLHMTPTEFRIKYAGNRVVLPNFEIITEGKEEDTSRLYSLALQILEQYIEK